MTHDESDDDDHYTDTDPLLYSDSDFGGLPHPNNTKGKKLPCIIRDVEAEVKEAQQSQSHIYPEQQQCQRMANRILYVRQHMHRQTELDWLWW